MLGLKAEILSQSVNCCECTSLRTRSSVWLTQHSPPLSFYEVLYAIHLIPVEAHHIFHIQMGNKLKENKSLVC